MKPWHLGFVIVLMMVLAAACSRKPEQGERQWCDFKTEKDGIILKASFPKGPVVWSEIVVLLNLNNCSAKPVLHGDFLGREFPSFMISIVNGRNENVAVTPRGEEEWPDYRPKTTKRLLFDCGSYMDVLLSPGKRLNFRMKLSDYFAVTRPGVYRLSLTWGGEVCLTSPPAESEPPGSLRRWYRLPRRSIDLELKDIRFNVVKPHWYSRQLTIWLVQ
jgi:hypothetical protein